MAEPSKVVLLDNMTEGAIAAMRLAGCEVLVLQSSNRSGVNTVGESTDQQTAHRVMAYLRTNDVATKVAADLPVPSDEAVAMTSFESSSSSHHDDSTLAHVFQAAEDDMITMKNKSLEGEVVASVSTTGGMPSMGMSSCPLPSKDIPFLGSANAPTMLAMIVAFSSVATVYASVNSGVHRITWLALLCLTCTGSVAFMLATDFLCRLPSTRFFGAVLRQRVTYIADNWQRHTVRSYLEIACWLGMMWGSYAASGGNVLVSVSVGTLTTMLAILAGDLCVLLLLNNAHYRRLGNATTWRDLEPASHAGENQFSGFLGTLCVLYLFSHFGYRLFLFIFFHHESLLTAVTLASIACVFMLVGGDLCARFEATKIMGLLMHQRISGATTNWRQHPFRSFAENFIWLGVVWGIYFFVYDSWLLAMILGSVMGGCAIYINYLMFPSATPLSRHVEPPQLATAREAHERAVRRYRTATVVPPKYNAADYGTTSDANYDNEVIGENNVHHDDNGAASASASLAGMPPSPLLTMAPTFGAPDQSRHHSSSVRVLGPSVPMVAPPMSPLQMQQDNAFASLLPHFINAQAHAAMHPGKQHYRPIQHQSQVMMSATRHMTQPVYQPQVGTIRSFLAPQQIARQPRHHHSGHTSHHNNHHGGGDYRHGSHHNNGHHHGHHSPHGGRSRASSVHQAPQGHHVPHYQYQLPQSAMYGQGGVTMVAPRVEAKRSTVLSVIADAAVSSNAASPESTPTNNIMKNAAISVAEAAVATPSPPNDRSASSSPVLSSSSQASSMSEPISPSPLAVAIGSVDDASSAGTSPLTGLTPIVTSSPPTNYAQLHTRARASAIAAMSPTTPTSTANGMWQQHQIAAMQNWAWQQQMAAAAAATAAAQAQRAQWSPAGTGATGATTAEEQQQQQAQAFMYHQAAAAQFAAQQRGFITSPYGNPAMFNMDTTNGAPSPAHAATVAAQLAAAAAMYGAPSAPSTPTVRRRTPRPAAPPGEGKGRRARRRRRFLASQAQLQQQQQLLANDASLAGGNNGSAMMPMVDVSGGGEDQDDEEDDEDDEVDGVASVDDDSNSVDTRGTSTSTSSTSSTDAPAPSSV